VCTTRVQVQVPSTTSLPQSLSRYRVFTDAPPHGHVNRLNVAYDFVPFLRQKAIFAKNSPPLVFNVPAALKLKTANRAEPRNELYLGPTYFRCAFGAKGQRSRSRGS